MLWGILKPVTVFECEVNWVNSFDEIEELFLPASTRSVPPGIHFALLLLLLLLLLLGGRPLIKLGNFS
jgi:hypothetical protein